MRYLEGDKGDGFEERDNWHGARRKNRDKLQDQDQG